MRDLGHSKYVHVKKTIVFPVCFVTVAPFDLTQTFPTIINSQRDTQIRKHKQKSVNMCMSAQGSLLWRFTVARPCGYLAAVAAPMLKHAHTRVHARQPV